MKKIGIDARLILRPMRGMPLYVTRLCQLLPSLGTSYQFYLFINKGYEHNDSPENYLPRLDNILAEHDNVSIINCDDDAEIRWEQIYLPRLVKQHKIDLLHTPGNRICFLPRVPTVVTLHDVMELFQFKQLYFKPNLSSLFNLRMALYNARVGAYVWAQYRYALKRADHIITVSDYSAQDIKKYLHVPEDRITAIHHGLDKEFMIASECDLKVFNDRTHVLMLGGDSWQKNPEGALAAWAKVPAHIRQQFPLRIVGFCGTDQSPLIQALRKNGLEHEVEVKGWVSQVELIEQIRSAALFLYLSRYEGFGFPALHAMASGTPVIGANAASIPEVLGKAGLTFQPDDSEAIAKGIEKLLNDRECWQLQADRGLERAQSFTWERSVQAHLDVYSKVLQNVH